MENYVIVQKMKTVKVAAAVIEKENKLLIAQRSYGEQAGLWEFPGGKVEAGEDSRQALIREIREEFSAEIWIKNLLCTVIHEYPAFILDMDCYICELKDEKLILHDHDACRWIDPFAEDVDWLEADKKVIAAYRKHIKEDQRKK